MTAPTPLGERVYLDATLFKAGDRVPDWLLTVEPNGTPDPVGVIFHQDAAVLDLPCGFVVVPTGDPRKRYALQVTAEGMHCGGRIMALERPVFVMICGSAFGAASPFPENPPEVKL